MTDLVVRRLLVDLEAPLPRDWCAGDPFRTAFFDALSMSFPVGEQFFIDAVRGGMAAMGDAAPPRLAAEVRGFVGQEATHRRLHALFNAHLASQGLVNGWAVRAEQRLHRLDGKDPRHAVAATAAYEHFTAIMADWMLAEPDLLADTEERLRTLWQWHAAEECEHKSIAFDVYRALGGGLAWRRRWFVRVTLIFLMDATRQTLSNLHRRGALWQLRTWTSAATWLFGRRGLVRCTFAPWRAYFRADFHPGEQDSPRSTAWLAANQQRFVAVGTGH